MTRAVERVAVVGRDAAAWISALAMQRAFGAAGVKVIALELPSLLEDSDVYAAVPSLAALHRLLGVKEPILARACASVPMVAQRFSNWSRSKQPFLHAYDSAPDDDRDLHFIHYWLKARAEGLRVDLEDFSVGAVAAKQGRVPVGGAAPTDLRTAAGYQLDAVAYAGLLKHLALRSGVEHRSGRLAGIQREAERILAVEWEGGETIEADLFIDASGAEAILARGMRGAAFESWSEWLPCDRLLTASAAPLRPLPAFSQVSAIRSGWIALHPLQDRTALIASLSSEFTEQETLDNLALLAGVRIESEAVVVPFEAGIRPRPWIGNCVAIGGSAVSLDPLDSMQLHMVHVGVSHLNALFPVSADTMPEAESYNAALVGHAVNVRDFQIAHYRLNRRFDEPFWDRARDAPVPEPLAAKLALFASCGQVPIYDHESFHEPNWAAIFIGHGMSPEGYDPRADLVPREAHIGKVQQRLRSIAEAVNAMPTVEQYLGAAAAASGGA